MRTTKAFGTTRISRLGEPSTEKCARATRPSSVSASITACEEA